MTQQAKRYVDLVDLLSVVLDCKHCKTSLAVPLMSDTFNIPHQCPSCTGQWYMPFRDGKSVGESINQLSVALKLLRRALEGSNADAQGFTLTMEVDGLASSPSSSSRDA